MVAEVIKNRKVDLVLITVGSQGLSDMHHLPLGILYVGSLLQKEGFDVKLHHILPKDIDQMVQFVCEREPLWVGFSVLSGMSTYWSAVASERIKTRRPSLKIIWGGHHPTILPADCLRESYVDIVVKGEGEETSLELTRLLAEDSTELGFVAGLSFKNERGEIIHNHSRIFIENLDNLPLNFELLDMKKYLGEGEIRNISFFSSRGCPFHCTFCSTPEFFGNTYRTHSVEYVLDKLGKLKKTYGVNSVYFADDNYYLNKPRARNIIMAMAQENINCDSIDVRLDQINDDDLLFFREYRVNGVFFGWESGNDRLLEIMNKHLTTDMILDKVHKIAAFHIPCWGSGIMLLPTETLEETKKTIDFSIRLRKILKGSTIGLFRFMPLPGTELTKLAAANGFKMPASQKEWEKIDPLENSYGTSWLTWLTPELDRKFRYVQECSRNEIAQFKTKGKIIKRMIHNAFASSLEKRFKSLDFNLFVEPCVYNLLRKLDALIFRRHYEPLKTKILSRYPGNLNE